MYKFYYEKLRVWQDAKKLVNEIYTLTKRLPRDEDFHLKSQMRRSASSVKSNIAEGQARHTVKDQMRFTVFAYSSLIELLNHLDTGVDQGYFKREDFLAIRDLGESVSRQLNALRKAQEARI